MPYQFNLRMQYRLGGDYQLFIGVHVPEELQPALLNGDVIGLHLDTLEVNSIASRLLPGGPSYVVLGVRCRNGEYIEQVPPAFKAARLKRHILGAAACLLGSGFLAAAVYPLVGGLALVLGTHALRTAREIPIRPFRVYRTYR